MYGSETSSLTLREEGRQRVFENKVLRSIFGPKRDEDIGCWRNSIMRSFITCTLRQVKLDAEVKEDEMAGHVARMGDKRTTYKILVGKPEGKR
jgi:hypothetical protein